MHESVTELAELPLAVLHPTRIAQKNVHGARIVPPPLAPQRCLGSGAADTRLWSVGWLLIIAARVVLGHGLCILLGRELDCVSFSQRIHARQERRVHERLKMARARSTHAFWHTFSALCFLWGRSKFFFSSFTLRSAHA